MVVVWPLKLAFEWRSQLHYKMHNVPSLMAWCTMCIVTEIILVGYMEKCVLCGESSHVCSVYFSIFRRKPFHSTFTSPLLTLIKLLFPEYTFHLFLFNKLSWRNDLNLFLSFADIPKWKLRPTSTSSTLRLQMPWQQALYRSRVWITWWVRGLLEMCCVRSWCPLITTTCSPVSLPSPLWASTVTLLFATRLKPWTSEPPGTPRLSTCVTGSSHLPSASLSWSWPPPLLSTTAVVCLQPHSMHILC